MEEFDNLNKNENLIEIKEERYPLGEVSNFRWLLSLLILNGAFLAVEIFQESMIAFGLFLIGPVISLLVLGNKAFRKLFLMPKLKDIPSIIGMTFLLLIVAMISGAILQNFDVVNNPIIDVVNKDNFKFMTGLMLVQLVIEEIFFIVWFLFLYHNVKIGTENSRTMIAWVGSSILFGIMHLSTYGFNIIQAVVGIGIIRFALSAIYVKKKNLTLSYMVHFLYDFIIISSVLFSNTIAN